MVMVYVSDIGSKAELNRAWDDWVVTKNLPLRTCVCTAFEGDDLVQLIATAAVQR